MGSGRCPGACSDEEWAFAVPCLTPVREDAPRRTRSLRELFNGLRRTVRAGGQRRMVPQDLPRWDAVRRQTRRWMAAGSFEAMADDLREPPRLAQGGKARPSAAILDARTLGSTPESGGRAGFDGRKKTKGSGARPAVDTPGHLLAPTATKASEQERAPVAGLCKGVQEAAGESVEHARVGQGYTGPKPRKAAAEHGIRLEVARLNEAERGFVLLPRRWAVEGGFAWASRFRRLARDYERLAESLAARPVLALAVLMLVQAAPVLKSA